MSNDPDTTISVASDEAFNPDWVKSQTPAYNPDFAASTATATTVASSATSSAIDSDAAASQYPSHSEFYTPQPNQASEAEEIARQKAAAEKNKGRGKGAAVGGAAAVAGIAGLCLVGPIVGVAAAGGAAYVAATNKGAAGSVFRASGTAATAVGSSARKFDQKHGVVAKTGRGIAGGVGWVAGKFRGNKQQQPQAS